MMPTPSFISALKSDRCVHYLNNALLNRAQSIDVSANVPSTVVDELGNPQHAGIVSAPADVALSVSVFDTGLDLSKNLTGKTEAASLALSDFVSAHVDYVGIVRDNAGNFFRSVYVKNACINSIGYSYDVAGNAVETYGLLGDNLTVFDGYVLTKTYTIAAADETNGYFIVPTTGLEAPVQTKQNSYFANAYLLRVTRTTNGAAVNLTEGNDYTYDPATKRITTSSLIAGAVWTVVFYSTQIGTPLSPEFNNVLPPAVRGEFTPVSIGVSSKTLIPRLQSANISINLAQKRIPQLGSKQTLFAPSGVPTVSGNFSALMSDLSLRKLLTYGSASSAETQFGIEQLPTYGTQNNLGLEVAIKSPVNNAILKRIVVPDITVTSGGMPTTVNGTLAESFSWTGKTGSFNITNN
ncbi:MAG: hypothetical protein H6Q72_1894 [Firmicutes bacterium]|nr:hypothetical protein [Bacillota bacterium]